MAAQKMDLIDIVIEEDGTVTSTVNQSISGPNHDAADAFMVELAKLMGGERKTTPIPGKEHHHHERERGRVHSHGGKVHSH